MVSPTYRGVRPWLHSRIGVCLLAVDASVCCDGAVMAAARLGVVGEGMAGSCLRLPDAAIAVLAAPRLRCDPRCHFCWVQLLSRKVDI